MSAPKVIEYNQPPEALWRLVVALWDKNTVRSRVEAMVISKMLVHEGKANNRPAVLVLHTMRGAMRAARTATTWKGTLLAWARHHREMGAEL